MLPSIITQRIPSTWRYWGTQYQCPFCLSRLRTMHPAGLPHPVLTAKQVIGGGARKHVVCPICHSIDRERLIYLYLQHKTEVLSAPCKLLHIAPETKLEKALRQCPQIEYITGDLLLDSVMVQIDVTNIQYDTATFDAIICNHVLEHVPADTLAMSELYRVLKPGGFALLQVPISWQETRTYEDPSITDPTERERLFGQDDHVRIYAGVDYIQRLESVGFVVAQFKWPEHGREFGAPHNRYALIEEEVLFVAQKPHRSS